MSAAHTYTSTPIPKMKTLVQIITLLLLLPLYGQAQTEVYLNLCDENKDGYEVQIKVKGITSKRTTYTMPAINYGGYSSETLKKRLNNFKAYDKAGKKLPFDFINNEAIEILRADELDYITYKVEDIFKGQEALILNHYQYVGYFEKQDEAAYQVRICRPETSLYAATSLDKSSSDETIDAFEAHNYYELFDTPIMYSQADTASFMVEGIQMQVAVHAPEQKVTAEELSPLIQSLVENIHAHTSVRPEKFHFIFYFEEGNDYEKYNPAQFKGQMHAQSTFFILPLIQNRTRLHQLIREIATHEYLHLLTPFHLRSHNMRHLNFAKSSMSKHLWLYEGAVEYFSQWLLMRGQFMSEQQFWEDMQSKLIMAERFPNMSLSKSSENIFEKKHQRNLANFYNRGALIAMMMDMLILEKTNGEMSLMKAIDSLAQKYGPDEPFYDGDLMTELAELTHSDVHLLYKDFIEGKKELPLSGFVNTVGYSYEEEYNATQCTFGNFQLRSSKGNDLVYFYAVKPNELGILNGDYLKKFNGQEVNAANIEIIKSLISHPPMRKNSRLEIIRAGKEMILEGKPECSYIYQEKVFVPLPKLSEKQELLHNLWHSIPKE